MSDQKAKLTAADFPHIKDLSHLEDVVSIQKILWYKAKDPSIDGVILVDTIPLGTVAGAMATGEEGAIANWHGQGFLNFKFELPYNQSVRCIRMEPYYLIEDTGQPHV